MSIKISYKTMTNAELIDEGLDCEVNSLAYELAMTLDALPIDRGYVQSVADDSCRSCSDLEHEISNLESEVSRLQDDLENLDPDRLIAGAKKARKAVKQAHDKLNYLFGLGGDDE